MRTTIGVLALAVASATAQSADPSLDVVITRVGQYVTGYGDKASLLVCTETYDQRFRPSVLGQPPARRLVSEFALVKTPGNQAWAGYRDVLDVDGKSVSDHPNRLEALFRSDAPDTALARRIADESARYNIGAITRNFNVPTATLFFFLPSDLAGFTFARKGEEDVDGTRVWRVDFKETARPTMIRTREGRDVPSHGTFWVIPEDGVVVRTHLVANGFMDASSTAEIDVRYTYDKRLEMWLPSVMAERYAGAIRRPSASGGTSIAVPSTATTGLATYTDFKRFQTSATIRIK